MVNVGIDIGAKNTKVVILKDDKEILGQGFTLTGFDQRASAEEALKVALEKAQLKLEDISHVIGTGVGRKDVPHASGEITEISALAKGANFLYPSARTVVDVGAEEGRAVKCGEKGNVKDFATNEKCAAGAGTFIETMARALETPLEDFIKLSLTSTKKIPMNAQCVIFAESEVVSLIHSKTSREDIVKAIHDAIADRIAAMVRRVGIEKDVILVGGMAKNIGFVDSLKSTLGVDLIIPQECEYVTALGAALTHD